MRIRKRKVPFPLSFLSPIPLSDPHLNFNGSPVVQLQPTHSNPPSNPSHDVLQLTHVHSQPSDHHPHQYGGTNGWDFFDASSGVHKDQKNEDHHLLELLENKEDHNKRVELDSEEAEKCNDNRKGSIFSSETVTSDLPESVTRCCEGENAFPPKKRRGSLKRSIANHDDQDTKTKINMNKKWIITSHDKVVDDDENEETKEAQLGSKGLKKKKKKKGIRGGAIMEGSRCSRVNGRGWRCCQQTLVGYSLCEHHLGKGRLRSMSSVRNLSKGTNLELQQNNNNNNNKAYDDSHEEENKRRLPLIMSSSSSKKKKIMKLGMVKARSISSLLGQPSTSAISTTDHNHIDNNN